MISIAHKIEIKPNNKQKTYFAKAFGCSRFAYNWGLAEWKRRHEQGEKCSAYEIKKSFNAIKKEQFPFVTEVSKYVTQQPFVNLGSAFEKFFTNLKSGEICYPQFKKKRDNAGSFYIGGDRVYLSDTDKVFKEQPPVSKSKKRQYVKIPLLGWVKMTERLRFSGKINGLIISQKGDKYFASFSVKITEAEYKRTHPKASRKQNRSVGIDLGVKTVAVLSDGLSVDGPKPMHRYKRKIAKLSRQLDKRTHARTKQEKLAGVKKSNNYIKLAKRLANAHRRIVNVRMDFSQKFTTVLVRHYSRIAVEDLDCNGIIMANRIRMPIYDVSMGEIIRELKYKSSLYGTTLVQAGTFFPSSRMCSCCGNVRRRLTLYERIYRCDKCGYIADRDFNASRNLLGLTCNHQIGMDYPESTPADLTALRKRFMRNGIATSKVETGKQRDICR